MRSLLSIDGEQNKDIVDIVVDETEFTIRLADNDQGRNKASMLINKMYAWRGYVGNHQVQRNPNRITLTASNKDSMIGTVTLNIDSDIGLLADDIFKDELDVTRARNRKLCELTKLAVDPSVRSKAVLASLFHVAFIYGRLLHKCTDVFIEVNPRHRRFYQHMLGFRMHGEVRINRRVDAPACLLSLDLETVEQQIQTYGGRIGMSERERSLYPYFFSPREEEGIANRLLALD